MKPSALYPDLRDRPIPSDVIVKSCCHVAYKMCCLLNIKRELESHPDLLSVSYDPEPPTSANAKISFNFEHVGSIEVLALGEEEKCVVAGVKFVHWREAVARVRAMCITGKPKK